MGVVGVKHTPTLMDLEVVAIYSPQKDWKKESLWDQAPKAQY